MYWFALQLEDLYVPKDYGFKRRHFANDIALVTLAEEVDVTAWTQPICVDWARQQPPIQHGQEGVVRGHS